MMNKSLLLKGLAGVAAVGGVVGGGIAFQEQIKGVFSSSSNAGSAQPVAEVKKDKKSNLTHKELIEKAGLSCGLEGDELANGETKDCSVKEGGSITVKAGDQTEEGVTFTANGSKLKVSKSEGESYSNKLKFVVDSGDITLNKKEGGSNLTNIQKLEQFETYEIKEEEGKYSLSRKTKADVGIKNALGLGEFALPEGGEVNRSYNDAKNIKKIRFEGQDGGITVTGEIGLKVSSTVDTTTFPFGYRFNFTFPQEVTIKSKSLKTNIPYDFKIKKGTGNALTLEKAWADDNTFTKKAGLDCGTNKECSVSSTDPKLNVKVGEQKKVDITNITSGTGKIKMETDQPGYNQGLKFTIADGNVTFTGGTGDVEKLEELETYEITEEGGKYYLTRKTSKEDQIKTSLSLPQGCELPTSSTEKSCSLNTEAFKNINFKDKSSPTSSGTVTLKISKTDSNDFPLGYKFSFNTTADATIASENKIKANIPTDFKIKKNDSTPTTMHLEKAWTAETLGKKVGLSCTGNNECSIDGTSSNKLRVKQQDKYGNDSKQTNLSKSNGSSSSAKIKVTKDQAGYNQGFKFEIEGGSIGLSGSTGSDTIDNLGEYETYEIKEVGNEGWFLVIKDKADDFIKEQLGIKDLCGSEKFPHSNSGTSYCNIDNLEKLKKIKFEGGTGHNWTGSVSDAQLEIKRATSLPGGFKFTFTGSSSTVCLPTGTTNQKVSLKGNSSGVEYKIKKSGSGRSATLTLERNGSSGGSGGSNSGCS